MRKGIISIIVATAVIGGAGTYGYAEMNAQHQAETQKAKPQVTLPASRRLLNHLHKISE
ncbi:Uncharacterised protein [Weissella viridescens]|uniref:Uncharacterized protein n=1 Tax=Weissella viridescens TaxID=1629 RepID=A0A380P1M7_WEIVI|nr:Uncharacterised protein [Weissella viridescens]